MRNRSRGKLTLIEIGKCYINTGEISFGPKYTAGFAKIPINSIFYCESEKDNFVYKLYCSEFDFRITVNVFGCQIKMDVSSTSEFIEAPQELVQSHIFGII